jgi:hypothetical protein
MIALNKFIHLVAAKIGLISVVFELARTLSFFESAFLNSSPLFYLHFSAATFVLDRGKERRYG